MNKTGWLTVNRPFLHSVIVLFALCLALVSPLIPVSVSAEQPDAAQHQYERGAALLRKGDLAAASEAARKAIELNPSSAEAHHLLGMIYFKEKKTAQAVDAFTQALKLKPAYPDALKDLAKVYRIQGKSAEAEQALKRAIETDPRHADSYFDLAKLYEQRRDAASAIKTVEGVTSCNIILASQESWSWVLPSNIS